MKFFIIVLLLFSTNIYAKELLAIVNGNEITTDVAHSDFHTMQEEQKKIAVQRLIDKELAIEYALAHNIINEKKFIDTYQHIVEKTTPKKQDGSLAEMLQNNKTSFTPEQERSKKGLLAFDMILDQKAAEMQPTKEALKTYYEANKDKYNTQKMYELLEIVVNSEDDAKMIIKQLDASALPAKAFRKIAVEKSLAPTKEKGGYLGQFYYAAMHENMKNALKNLSINQYSQPFKTDFGYVILFVMGFQDEVIRNYKESQINVKQDYIRETVIHWAFNTIDALKQKARIKIVQK